MPSKTSPAARVSINFHAAEWYYKADGRRLNRMDPLAHREIACACYLAGLKILNEESDAIPPRRFLELCAFERRILINYILPSGDPCPSSSR